MEPNSESRKASRLEAPFYGWPSITIVGQKIPVAEESSLSCYTMLKNTGHLVAFLLDYHLIHE